MVTMRIAAIRVEDVTRRLRLDEQIWRRAVPQGIMTLVGEMVPATVEMNTPKLSGNLIKSANIRVWPTKLHIWFDAPYAVYVDEGFPASEGRYVPAIGKRLVNVSKTNPNIGTHPGYGGAHFSEAIANDLKEDLRSIIDVVIKQVWVK